MNNYMYTNSVMMRRVIITLLLMMKEKEKIQENPVHPEPWKYPFKTLLHDYNTEPDILSVSIIYIQFHSVNTLNPLLI